jgi:hypothetical protein
MSFSCYPPFRNQKTGWLNSGNAASCIKGYGLPDQKYMRYSLEFVVLSSAFTPNRGKRYVFFLKRFDFFRFWMDCPDKERERPLFPSMCKSMVCCAVSIHHDTEFKERRIRHVP